jgi:U2 small nuclear ribonucleoprotein A'
LFLTADGLMNSLATTLSTTVSTGAAKNVTMAEEPRPVVAPGKAGRLLTKDDANKVREAIAKATSVEEIRRLERSLKEGFLPSMESVGA